MSAQTRCPALNCQWQAVACATPLPHSAGLKVISASRGTTDALIGFARGSSVQIPEEHFSAQSCSHFHAVQVQLRRSHDLECCLFAKHTSGVNAPGCCSPAQHSVDNTLLSAFKLLAKHPSCICRSQLQQIFSFHTDYLKRAPTATL